MVVRAGRRTGKSLMSTRKTRISRVTTRQGDRGETRLADGTKLSKTEPVFAAMGDVDELNSQVGLLLCEVNGAESPDLQLVELLLEVQQQLFDLGAHLATVGQVPAPAPDVIESRSTAMNAALPPLAEFVLPGGSRAASHAHVCRAVCRRAERSVWGAHIDDAGRYLNRLSDFFFVLARVLNAREQLPEDLWRGT